MADVLKSYIDLAGLQHYDEKIKDWTDDAIDAKIGALDTSSDVGIASKSGNAVTIAAGISETDGVIGAGSGTAITLADVAATGAAGDVSYDNGTSGLTATNVQAAIDAVAAASAGGVNSKTVYATKTNGGSEDTFAARYTIYQGANGDASSPVAAEKVIDIDVLKDQFLDDSDLVDITYSEGHLYDGVTDVTEIIKGAGGTATAADAGKYIKLVFAQPTKSTIYMNVKDLVDVYTGGTTAEATVAVDANNEITVTINNISGSKIVYKTETTTGAGDGETVNQALARLDGAASTTGSVAQKIATAIEGLDATESQTAGADGLALSVTEVDGVITGISGSIAANTYDAYGAAAAAVADLDVTGEVGMITASSTAGTDVVFKTGITEADGIVGAGANTFTLSPISDAAIDNLFTPTP